MTFQIFAKHVRRRESLNIYYISIYIYLDLFKVDQCLALQYPAKILNMYQKIIYNTLIKYKAST